VGDLVPTPLECIRARGVLTPLAVPSDDVLEEFRLIGGSALREILPDAVRILTDEADVEHDGGDGDDRICRLFGDVVRRFGKT
jgi:hypothetical protein